MKTYSLLLLILSYGIFISCRTINTTQTTMVKRFAGTAKDVSDMPYKILYNYYFIKFKRKQLIPENYVTGDIGKEELDQVAENVILRIEEIRDDYYEDLKTASEIKTVYELLATYINSLEKLSSDRYAKEFEKQSAVMGTRMNGLITRLNASPRTKRNLSLSPAEWLSSLMTMHGRIKLKTKQADLLKEYINEADTLVQAINLNYQEIQAPIMKAWFDEEKEMIRDQFKRSIAPYLQTMNRHPDSTGSIVAIEFYSRINPIYYELTDEIYRNQLLIEQTGTLMNNLANTHRSMKAMFAPRSNWFSIAEEIDGLKEKLFVLQELFNKEGREKFNFYKNFLMLNEKPVKDIINKQ
ncbi:MAG: hypothetical protein JNN00_10510 [Chitinophagaceae bacterium]|nr:hypothetical protein [Chitinophagaceae bacterium]